MNPDSINADAFADVPRLARVKRFIDQHYAEPLPLEIAARVAGLERTYFSRFFRRKTGVGYRSWLLWFRVQRALELMERHDLTITEVALEVGFGNLRTFERVFRRCTGSCPSVVRQGYAGRADSKRTKT
jgi:AraC-like DNA-binding protein